MLVVSDLDGTLALTEHRADHLCGPRKDWRAFYAACDKDEPCHKKRRNTMRCLDGYVGVQPDSAKSAGAAKVRTQTSGLLYVTPFPHPPS